MGILAYALLSPTIIELYDKLLGIYSDIKAIYSFLVTFILRKQTIFIILILLASLIFYLLYKLKKAVSIRIAEYRTHILSLKDKQKEIQILLNVDLDTISFEKMKGYVHSLLENIELSSTIGQLRRYRKLLKTQLEEARVRVKELKHESRVEELNFKKKKVELEIQQLKEEKERQRIGAQNRHTRLVAGLIRAETNVFRRYELIPEEIDILHEWGYEDANEYDITERRIIPVLVKKVLNHTKTHTFLVWSVKNYLEKLEGVDMVEQHDTKYPDLTFLIGDDCYAIEIETGSLLRKKRQANAKVNFLHKRFYGQWIFVVSNKNLLPAYRKLGPTTQRSDVAKNLKNWVKLSI